jgi:hypothetical protein|eukprot:COSAG01_NODE_10925_length_2049_cov_1.479487_3_plen_261_part_00
MGDAQWSSEANVVLFDMGAVYGNWHRTIGDTQAVGCIHANAKSPPPSYCLNHPLEETAGTSAAAAAAATTTGDITPPCSLCCDAAVTSKQRFGCYSAVGIANQSFEHQSGAVPGVVPFDNVAGWVNAHPLACAVSACPFVLPACLLREPANLSLWLLFWRQPADPAWGAAAIVIPHAVWKHTADKTAARAAYPTMRRYAEFLIAHVDAADGLVRFGMLGDWNPLATDSQPSTARLQKGRTPVPQVRVLIHWDGSCMISTG